MDQPYIKTDTYDHSNEVCVREGGVLFHLNGQLSVGFRLREVRFCKRVCILNNQQYVPFGDLGYMIMVRNVLAMDMPTSNNLT